MLLLCLFPPSRSPKLPPRLGRYLPPGEFRSPARIPSQIPEKGALHVVFLPIAVGSKMGLVISVAILQAVGAASFPRRLDIHMALLAQDDELTAPCVIAESLMQLLRSDRIESD